MCTGFVGPAALDELCALEDAADEDDDCPLEDGPDPCTTAGGRAGGENDAGDGEQRDEQAAADAAGGLVGRYHRTRVSDARTHRTPPGPYEPEATGSRRALCTAGSSPTSRGVAD